VRGELGALLLGRIAGRESPEDITLFKSVGLAVEDAAAAHWVYAGALREDLGADMNLHMDTSRHER
jgi:ornithine cyclodeaminase/alanine dehydrogenase-like protein (mu-crystallin family)